MPPAAPAPTPDLPPKRLQWGTTALLAAGAAPLELSNLLAWLSWALLLLLALKLAEARRARERRLVALLQLLVTGLLAAQLPELLPSLLQLLACVGALAGLLQLDLATGLSWVVLLRRSLRLLLAVLPLALLLLVLAPRLGPLWPSSPGLGGAGLPGLNEALDPGSISALADDPGPAARVSFSPGVPPPLSQRLWRVLVHSRFDGSRWLAGEPLPAPLPWLQPQDGSPSQLWLVEPSRQQQMPWDGASLPTSPAAQIDRSGTVRLNRPAAERRLLVLQADGRAGAWRQLPPSAVEQAMPWGSNPRLEALGRSWRRLPPPQRLDAARTLLASGAYRYTRQPGVLPSQGGLDVLLFESRAGFCGHYASAFSALMRAAGLPARVVSGYEGGRWMPTLGGGGYLDLRQSDAHAWSEVWLDNRWLSLDPSSWLGDNAGRAAATASNGSWWSHLQAQWWGLELGWSRWWVGFDQGGQQELLRRLLGDQPTWLGALLLLAAGVLLGLARSWLPRHSRRPSDRLGRELQRWRRQLERRGISVRPGETLPQLAERLAAGPDRRLADQARALAWRHQRERFQR